MNKKTLRPAIAMIELIFAIVIMGIVLMSTPMLISTAATSSFVTIQQEAINEAASQVNMIMGYHWDENSADERYIDPVLKTDSSTAGLTELNTTASPYTGRRPGTPEESYRTFVREDGERKIASSTLGEEGAGETKDDMDDFSGPTTNLVLVAESTLIADNVETNTIDINTAISYSNDTATYNSSNIAYDPFASATGSTNIKSITVTLTSTSGVEELDKEIILRAFSCNIGGYKLEEKDF